MKTLNKSSLTIGIAILALILSSSITQAQCDDQKDYTIDMIDPASGKCIHVPVFIQDLIIPKAPVKGMIYVGTDVVVNDSYVEEYSSTPIEYLLNPDPNEQILIASKGFSQEDGELAEYVVAHIFVPSYGDDLSETTVELALSESPKN